MSTNLISGSQPLATELDRPLYTPIKRRSFFMYAGATAGATALVLAGCKDNSDSPGMVSLGTGDVGVLNYAYALEQLEAAFYTQLRMGTYYLGTATVPATAAEKAILDDLYYHEVIHRDFFKAAITSVATPIKALTPNFSAIDFSSRASVLGAAKTFEDLGVQAYNGAGQYITNPGYLYIAGKIVSVEARHAAVIRDLLTEGSFVASDVINSSSQELSKAPNDVITAANAFLADGSKISSPGTF
ncbi:MAG: ferritin-like domain-containing protein [Hymenobacter sp.]|nr:MAG: ferritin-like domain-containing protein [Hymenobacter sp.]